MIGTSFYNILVKDINNSSNNNTNYNYIDNLDRNPPAVKQL